MTLDALPEAEAAIVAQWPLLGAAGDWWTGAERVALIAETRAARSCALCDTRRRALSPEAGAEPHAARESLSATAVDAVHRVASDPGRLSSRWFKACCASGLEAAQVVELGGVVGCTQFVDTLAQALGRAVPALPEAQAGEPTRQFPPGLETKNAWAPMVAPDAAQGLLKALYQGVQAQAGFVFNVVRALSVAPQVCLNFFRMFMTSYHTDGPAVADALSRTQVEFLAASTSAHNDCFY